MARSLATALTFALLVCLVPQPHRSQSTAEQGLVEKGSSKAEVHQALLDLTNPWTVMCVAAHPDDEDGSTLTVLRRKYGVHTVSLFSTYGEGGQNAVGPELYEELGVIRARETIAAAAVQGSEPYFLGLTDFGFSKSAEETFRAWGRTEALRRMVLQIRKLRPDAIITNHDTSRGHGHHQATGQLILEAFDAAADPQRFPEQLNQVKTWQVQRLFVRGARTQSSTTTDSQPTASQQITIDPNEMDPMRGTTYAQQALLGLQKHATQGPWPKSIPATGGRRATYSVVRSAAAAAPLPTDAKTPIDGLQLPEAIRSRFTPPTIDDKPLTGFAGSRTELLVALMNAKRRGAFSAAKEIVDQDPERFRLMSSRLDMALAKITGVSTNIRTREVLVPAGRHTLEVTLENIGEEEVAVKRWVTSGLPIEQQLDGLKRPDKLLPGTSTYQEIIVTPPRQTPVSVPSAEHLYDGRLFGSELKVEAELEIEGVRFLVSDAERLEVAPHVEITNNNPSPCVETPATALSCSGASLTLTNHWAKFAGSLQLTAAPLGVKLESTKPVSLGAKAIDRFATGPMATRLAGNDRANLREREWNIVSVLRDDSKNLVTERSFPATYIPAIAVAGIQVGYVPSFDSSLKHALSALGVQAKELTPQDVATQDLSGFTTIIVDNRGYEAHPELIASNDKLLRFAEDGGTLIVFYHKTNEWNPDERRKRPQLAPFPIIVGDDRVTEETAPITFLQPRHPLMTFPNQITQKDFAGWIQERGLYYPSEWDAQYTALFSTSDTGESPLKGGLLVAKYGKGNYIYTSMVWYRQLRAGVPGGYRFFANMISYGKAPAGASGR
jgi:LmbE family N-acetylglucosaminyl deacetylase